MIIHAPSQNPVRSTVRSVFGSFTHPALVFAFDPLSSGLKDEISGTRASFTRSGSLTGLRPNGLYYYTVGADEPLIGPWGLMSDGAGTQYFVNPHDPVTQTISLSSTGYYTLWVDGSGSAALSANTASISTPGTATEGSHVTFEVTATGTVDVTITDPLEWCQLESGQYASSRIYNDGTPGDGSTASRASQDADSNGNGVAWDLSKLHPDVLKSLDGTSGEGTLIVKWRPEFSYEDMNTGIGAIISVKDSQYSILYVQDNGKIKSYDGVSTGSQQIDHSAKTTYSTVARWGNLIECFLAGASGNAVDFSGTFGIDTHLRLAYSNEYPQHFGPIKLFSAPLSDAEIEREASKM